jgi:hypothetical protein
MQTDATQKSNWLGSCLSVLSIMGIFLVVGAGLAYWGWNILQNARASASWPTANGVITRSVVTHSTDSDGGDSYSPEVTFTYTVNDTGYANDTIKFGENSYSSRRKAEGIAGNYPVGKNVIVYYNPEKPNQSVLEPGVSAGSYIVLGIGVLFILISLIIGPISFFLRTRV